MTTTAGGPRSPVAVAPPLRPIATRSLAGRPGPCPSVGSGAPSCWGAAGGLPRGALPRAPVEGAPGRAQREIPVSRPGMEVPGDFLRGACWGVLWRQVPHDGEHPPCGEGPRPRRGVHLDGPLWARAPHAGCVEHPTDHVCRRDQHHFRGLYDYPLRRSAVAAPGGHFSLARVGYSVVSLLDVQPAGCGFIRNLALRHPVAQGGACGRMPHLG